MNTCKPDVLGYRIRDSKDEADLSVGTLMCERESELNRRVHKLSDSSHVVT